MEPLRIALVGLGWWGRKLATAMSAVPETITLLRAVEPDPAARAGAALPAHVARSADYQDALDDPRVEAVVLATPHSLHEAQIADAVAAGKHIFCEKPLALTRQGAEQAMRLCHDAGLVLGMGHERRFEPPMAALLEDAAAGRLGRIQQIEANFSHDKFIALGRDNWRLQAAQAPAAGMTATGIHLLDLSVRLLGRAESVLCHCETLSSDLPQGDTVAAFVRFCGGGTAYVSASLANPFISRFAVFGSKGWVEILDKAHVEAPEGWVVTTALAGEAPTRHEVPAAEAVRENLCAFARAVRGVAPYPITGEQLVNNIALLEAVFRSAVSGRMEAVG